MAGMSSCLAGARDLEEGVSGWSGPGKPPTLAAQLPVIRPCDWCDMWGTCSDAGNAPRYRGRSLRKAVWTLGRRFDSVRFFGSR